MNSHLPSMNLYSNFTICCHVRFSHKGLLHNSPCTASFDLEPTAASCLSEQTAGQAEAERGWHKENSTFVYKTNTTLEFANFSVKEFPCHNNTSSAPYL